MRTRPLGQSGIEASVVAFGAWVTGGWMWGGATDDDSIDAIHAAIDAGVTLIDTAPVYGFGVSEEVVGKALAGRRDKVVLATKCALVTNPSVGVKHFSSNARGFDDDGLVQVNRYAHPDSIRKEIEGSLSRLGTDYIDLYQTHWQDPTTPIEDTMAALLSLKEQGKIRAIGVSNASAEQMATYRKVGPLDTDQEKYSMLARDIEQDQLPYCHEHDIAMLAYSPLAQGLLTGKLGPERAFPPGDIRGQRPLYSVENRRRVADMLNKFQPIADERGVPITHVVIAWTLSQPGLTHVLCGARTKQQAIENAAAGDLELTDAELKIIDEAIDAYHAAGVGA